MLADGSASAARGIEARKIVGSPLAPELGMVMEFSHTAFVVDSQSSSMLGSVSIVPASMTGDCVISPDGRLGVTNDFSSRLWLIDLYASPPQLAAGTNPVPISNDGQDIATSYDGRFVLTCDGFYAAPISVVDIATRVEIDALDFGGACSSIDACRDGSVLVATRAGQVRRFVLDAEGQLNDTGETLVVAAPFNVYCAPDGASGVAVSYSGGTLHSFRVSGMVPVSTRSMSGPGPVSGAFAVDGTKFFVRSETGILDAFGYDPSTSQFGTTPIFTLEVGALTPYSGIEQLALDPQGNEALRTGVGWTRSLRCAQWCARRSHRHAFAPLADGYLLQSTQRP